MTATTLPTPLVHLMAIFISMNVEKTPPSFNTLISQLLTWGLSSRLLGIQFIDRLPVLVMATPRFGSYQLTVREVYTTSVLNFLILDMELLTPVLSDLEK